MCKREPGNADIMSKGRLIQSYAGSDEAVQIP
jgi:hypothetical protein